MFDITGSIAKHLNSQAAGIASGMMSFPFSVPQFAQGGSVTDTTKEFWKNAPVKPVPKPGQPTSAQVMADRLRTSANNTAAQSGIMRGTMTARPAYITPQAASAVPQVAPQVAKTAATIASAKAPNSFSSNAMALMGAPQVLDNPVVKTQAKDAIANAKKIAGIDPNATPFPSLKGYAEGGEVKGPGTATSDSIPAALNEGDFILSASATKKLGADNLNAMLAKVPKGDASSKTVPALISNGEYHVPKAMVDFYGRQWFEKQQAAAPKTDAVSYTDKAGVKHLAAGEDEKEENPPRDIMARIASRTPADEYRALVGPKGVEETRATVEAAKQIPANIVKPIEQARQEKVKQLSKGYTSGVDSGYGILGGVSGAMRAIPESVKSPAKVVALAGQNMFSTDKEQAPTTVNKTVATDATNVKVPTLLEQLDTKAEDAKGPQWALKPEPVKLAGISKPVATEPAIKKDPMWMQSGLRTDNAPQTLAWGESRFTNSGDPVADQEVQDRIDYRNNLAAENRIKLDAFNQGLPESALTSTAGGSTNTYANRELGTREANARTVADSANYRTNQEQANAQKVAQIKAAGDIKAAGIRAGAANMPKSKVMAVKKLADNGVDYTTEYHEISGRGTDLTALKAEFAKETALARQIAEGDYSPEVKQKALDKLKHPQYKELFDFEQAGGRTASGYAEEDEDDSGN